MPVSTLVSKAVSKQQQDPRCRTCQRTDQEVGCGEELPVADRTLRYRMPALHTAPHQPQEGCEVLPLGRLQLPQDRL